MRGEVGEHVGVAAVELRVLVDLRDVRSRLSVELRVLGDQLYRHARIGSALARRADDRVLVRMGLCRNRVHQDRQTAVHRATAAFISKVSPLT